VDFELRVVRVFVSDWERALRFYTETLGIPESTRDDALGWAQLATGACQLALEHVAADDAEGRRMIGRFVGATLAVEDIEATHAMLVERGVAFVAPPRRQPWGGVLAHLKDPDGNVITLLGTPA
jgi:predicted enzyme related to lactoylglutathione lyase